MYIYIIYLCQVTSSTLVNGELNTLIKFFGLGHGGGHIAPLTLILACDDMEENTFFIVEDLVATDKVLIIVVEQEVNI